MNARHSGAAMGVLAATGTLALAAIAAGDQVSLVASADNSIFEASSNSAGAFEHIFAGRTATSLNRRALIRFDLSSIPPGSTIESSRLTLHLTMTNFSSGERHMELRRLNADWGEGASTGLGAGGMGFPVTPGSATWGHRFHDTQPWASPGGDFAAQMSAMAMVNDLGPYDWQSAQLTADVQAWLDAPATNFGWMLLGDEGELGTAKRFASREHKVTEMRPTLHITYTSSCYANCDGSTVAPVLNIDDFTCFINRFAHGQALPHAQQVEHYANCDGSTVQPALNIDDFTCFINLFALGCP